MPPTPISTVAVRVDAETLEWFRAKGEESEQHMATALKIYVAPQKTATRMSLIDIICCSTSYRSI